jgi:hypothetical protein
MRHEVLHIFLKLVKSNIWKKYNNALLKEDLDFIDETRSTLKLVYRNQFYNLERMVLFHCFLYLKKKMIVEMRKSRNMEIVNKSGQITN